MSEGKEEIDKIIFHLKVYKNKILNKKEILLNYKLIPHPASVASEICHHVV